MILDKTQIIQHKKIEKIHICDELSIMVKKFIVQHLVIEMINKIGYLTLSVLNLILICMKIIKVYLK